MTRLVKLKPGLYDIHRGVARVGYAGFHSGYYAKLFGAADFTKFASFNEMRKGVAAL